MPRPKSLAIPFALAVLVGMSAIVPVSAAACDSSEPAPSTAVEVTVPMIDAVSDGSATPIEQESPCAFSAGDPELQPVLESIEINYCPMTLEDGSRPDWMAKPHRRGYCRCSCGYPCETSADCGGSSCDRFITCC